MKEEKKYILYITKNLINKKIYIGVHGTFNINDSYIGSGKSLKKAIKKYGRENFKRYNIIISDDINFVYALENKIVTKDFVSKDFNYNLEIGGKCVSHSDSTKRKIGDKHKGRKMSIESRIKMSDTKRGRSFLSENNNSKVVIDKESGRVFNSLKEASIFENMNYNTFKWAIKNKKYFKYTFEDGLAN